MVKFLAFLILGMCFYVLFKTCWIGPLNQARRRGMYPRTGKPTLFDVKRLLVQGDKESAVRLYCAILKTRRHEAQKAVEELERSIQGKNSG